VQTVFADGSARFILDTIHTKNMNVRAMQTGHVPVGGSHDNWVPAIPLANAQDVAEGTDAVAGQPFSWGVWAELGAVNSGGTPSL
jgi:hypothetical protein